MEKMIKIQSDRERAASLLALAELRLNKIKTFDEAKESSLIAEGFYEVTKEMITSLLFIDGYKTLSHKDLIDYIFSKYKGVFPEHEINMIDRLRKLRNNIVYYGVSVEPSFIKRNKQDILQIISKLDKLCRKKLAD